MHKRQQIYTKKEIITSTHSFQDKAMEEREEEEYQWSAICYGKEDR
jgi:hypothetical protein